MKFANFIFRSNSSYYKVVLYYMQGILSKSYYSSICTQNGPVGRREDTLPICFCRVIY
jgi:hypothetical protein